MKELIISVLRDMNYGIHIITLENNKETNSKFDDSKDFEEYLKELNLLDFENNIKFPDEEYINNSGFDRIITINSNNDGTFIDILYKEKGDKND